MKHVLLMLAAFAFIGSSWAAGSGSSTQSKRMPGYLKDYNQGVELMMDKRFTEAELKFREVLSEKASMAEAHNNLAYVLRKQGSEHFDEALSHYSKAVQLSPKLPEPYMYRGVLYVQMGQPERAKADLSRLQRLGSEDLANELAYVIERGEEKQPEQFFGVSAKQK